MQPVAETIHCADPPAPQQSLSLSGPWATAAEERESETEKEERIRNPLTLHFVWQLTTFLQSHGPLLYLEKLISWPLWHSDAQLKQILVSEGRQL